MSTNPVGGPNGTSLQEQISVPPTRDELLKKVTGKELNFDIATIFLEQGLDFLQEATKKKPELCREFFTGKCHGTLFMVLLKNIENDLTGQIVDKLKFCLEEYSNIDYFECCLFEKRNSPAYAREIDDLIKIILDKKKNLDNFEIANLFYKAGSDLATLNLLASKFHFKFKYLRYLRKSLHSDCKEILQTLFDKCHDKWIDAEITGKPDRDVARIILDHDICFLKILFEKHPKIFNEKIDIIGLEISIFQFLLLNVSESNKSNIVEKLQFIIDNSENLTKEVVKSLKF